MRGDPQLLVEDGVSVPVADSYVDVVAAAAAAVSAAAAAAVAACVLLSLFLFLVFGYCGA
jgi:hypothetical protein